MLPTGGVRLDVGGHFSHFGSRFGVDATEPADGWYASRVTGVTGQMAEATSSGIERFLESTGGGAPAGPAILGTPDVAFHGTTREIPIRLAIGLVPRTELTFRLAIARDEVLVQRFWLEGGTLGRNPDPQGNAELLAGIHPDWGELFAGLLLPVSESELGMQLRAHVMALTGEELLLPESAADAELLGEILNESPGLSPPPSGLRPWRAGDLEAGIRVRVLSTFGDLAYPAESSGLHARVAASLAARLPTGQRVRPAEPFTQLEGVGQSGIRGGVDVDLFAGSKFWFSGGAGILRLGGTGSTGEEEPEAGAVVWSPSHEIALRAAPRYRLTETISIGGRYEMARSGRERREIRTEGGDFTLITPAGTVQRAGLEVRYSTLPALGALPRGFGSPLPLEFAVGYLQTFAGPSGAPAPRTAFLQASVLHRFWGGDRR